MQIDTSEITRLAADLGRAGVRAVGPTRAAVEASAVAVRDSMRAAATGHPRFRAFPASITHDVRGLDAEIGPDKSKRQGALGNLLYFGTARSGPTLPHPSEALGQAVPVLERALAGITDL